MDEEENLHIDVFNLGNTIPTTFVKDEARKAIKFRNTNEILKAKTIFKRGTGKKLMLKLGKKKKIKKGNNFFSLFFTP